MKGHDENSYGNSRADALADAGRDQDTPVEADDEEWIDAHPQIPPPTREQRVPCQGVLWSSFRHRIDVTAGPFLWVTGGVSEECHHYWSGLYVQ